MGGEDLGGGGGGGFGGGGGGLDLGGGGDDFGGDDLGGEEDLGGEPEVAPEGDNAFGEGFRSQNKSIIDKLLLEGRRKNEDIIMMTEGIKNLIGAEESEESDDEINNDEEDLLPKQ